VHNGVDAHDFKQLLFLI